MNNMNGYESSSGKNMGMKVNSTALPLPTQLPMPQNNTTTMPAPVAFQQVEVNITEDPVKSQNFMDEIGQAILSTKTSTLLKFMRMVNLILACATIASGVLAWYQGRVDSFQHGIAGVYIIMFGVLLVAFELRNDALDRTLRQNFGFMYNNSTRTMFLLFIAIWPLSMGNYWITVLDSFCLFVNAFFNYFVIHFHPAFSHHTQVDDITQVNKNPLPPQPPMNQR